MVVEMLVKNQNAVDAFSQNRAANEQLSTTFGR
jgi:hypothetical protein